MNSLYIPSLRLVLLTATALAGLLTWLRLNKRSVRGDHAVVFYTASFTFLYVATRWISEAPFRLSLLLAGTYTWSALFCTVAYRLSPYHPLAGYPGPWTWWISSLYLTYVSFKGRRHLVVDSLHLQYGPFVRIGPDILSINSPSAHLIYSVSSGMEKSDAYTTPGHLEAVALIFKQKTKELHSNRKRIWSNAFTSANVAHFFPPLERSAWQLIKCIESRRCDDGTVDLSECLAHWSYDFMGEMVFGGSWLTKGYWQELMKNGDPQNMVENGKKGTVITDSFGQTPWLMDIMWHLPAGKDLQRLRNRAADMMRTRIKVDKDTNMRDLSSHLLAGDPVTGEQIPLADLELDSVIAVQAGSDNTSITMTLTFYFLLSQPLHYKTLQAELEDAFPDPMSDLDPTQLCNLKFLNAVIDETLRLGSPFFLPRIVPSKGTTIDGRFIPQGMIVALAAYSQQVSPDNFYPDPWEFLPQRWLPGGLGPGSRVDRDALASFSSGPHMCVAKNFAYQEMRFVLARLVLAFDMKLPESFNIKGFRDGILNMRTTILELPLIVEARRRSALDVDVFL